MVTDPESRLSGFQVAPGDHVCTFYPSLADRDEILFSYLRDGLHTDQKCVCVVDTDPDPVLDTVGTDVDVAVVPGRRQLEVLSAEDTYLRDGSFSTEGMLDFLEHGASAHLQGGYGFVRWVGEMTWALRQMPGVEELAEYEARLNRFVPRYPQAILCMYELDRFSGQILVDSLKTHPKILIGGMVLENPYYLDPDEFLALRK